MWNPIQAEPLARDETDRVLFEAQGQKVQIPVRVN